MCMENWLKGKPFRRLEFRIGRFYYINEWVRAIAFSEEQSSELNIGDNYKVAILLTRYNGQAFAAI